MHFFFALSFACWDEYVKLCVFVKMEKTRLKKKIKINAPVVFKFVIKKRK